MARVVTRSELIRDGHLDRLDAEYHSGPVVALEADMAASGAARLADLADLVDSRVPDPAGEGEPDDEFLYVEISDIDTRDGFALAESVLRRYAPSRARVKLAGGDVVLSSVRPARNAVTLISEDLADAVGSTGFIVLRATDLEPELLFLLLKTPGVVDQLTRRARASMYPALHPPDVSSVMIRLPDRTTRGAVVTAVQDAFASKAEYLAQHARAMRAVQGFLDGADPEGLYRDLASHEPHLVSRHSLADAGRMDAEFHAPAFGRAIGRMEALGRVVTLRELEVTAATGSTPASDAYTVDPSGIPVIKVASLSGRGIIWPSVARASARYTRRAGADIADGDLLLTSSAHAPMHIGRKVDVVRDIPAADASQLTFVGELMRLRLPAGAPISPEYLAAFLRHPLGNVQVRRAIRGITSHAYPDDVLANVSLPIPPEDLTREVSEAATRAHSARARYRETIRGALSMLAAETD